MLGLLEKQSEAGSIDLFYGDESQVAESGYVPYGWVFEDEVVEIPAQRGKTINIWGLLGRDNRFVFSTTHNTIDADFVLQRLDDFSLNLRKTTVVVLDNASVHTAQKIKERFQVWQNRGLFIFYLPPYSPHLNIIERLWKELKARWIMPADYISTDTLFYAVQLALAAVGDDLSIAFSKFNGN